MTVLTCWTAADLETQPRIRTTGPGRVEATLLVGAWSAVPGKINISVRAEYSDQGQWRLVGPAAIRRTELVAAEFERRDEAANSAERAHAWLESTRHLVDVRQHLQRQATQPALYPRQRYFEVVLSDLPAGALLRCTATAVHADIDAKASSLPAGLWLVDPEFAADDVVGTRTPPDDRDDQWWVLMRREDDGFEHLRLDLLKTHNLTRRLLASNLAPVRISLDGQAFDADRAQPISPGPVDEGFVGVRVDRSTDSVLLTRRRPAVPTKTITVTTRADGSNPDSHPVTLSTSKAPRPVALMVVAYAIQGLNDLFAEPLDRYDPPRSFAEVAYSDEKALFSGRPESAENSMADGYRYVLMAQRDYQVPAVWAFNAGALLLLKHSLPARRFEELTAAVRDGVISVANAGTGAHRNCCYAAETNVEEITRADQLIKRILTHQGIKATTNGLYFPDSRVYEATPAELASYATLISSGVVTTVLLDRSTVAHRDDGSGSEQLYFGDQATEDNGNHLWKDTVSGLRVALIEDRVRNQLVSGSEDELPRGQLEYGLRRLFMSTLANQSGPTPKLFCFGDDIDHLAGNGWFDGDYAKIKAFSRAFLAAVCWVHTHPWMQARTVGDPGFEADFLRTDEELAVSSAIDATMDPGGVTTLRGAYDEPLHFDAWVKAWAATPSPWLGVTLAEITQELQAGLISWPEPHRNELYEIAWTYFLSCTHESMWSKEPLEGIKERRVDAPFSWEPEDFVISESLQMRNAWVYLNAAVWATWADANPGSGTFVLDPATVDDVTQCGSLIDDLRAAHSADAWWTGAPASGHGLYWDRDLMPNTVLYNDEVLAVLDRNGGRITQLFSRVNGRPVAVSGTNKAYQFLNVGPPQVACDGQRVQNTVYTPNHAYVATDVLQARPRPGTYLDLRPTARVNPTWLPDNLNAYACAPLPGPAATVECRYQETPPAQLPSEDPLPWATVAAQLELDGDQRRAGQPGVVWHESAPFRKTIELTGRTLRVHYHDTEVGHLVANEFSVDLLALLQGGDRQIRVVGDSVATVTSAAGDTVTITLGADCGFSDRCRQPDGPGSRVLTENIEIVGLQAGGFDYTIELPS